MLERERGFFANENKQIADSFESSMQRARYVNVLRISKEFSLEKFGLYMILTPNFN